MSYIADRFVVLLDTNVLYPFRKRDALLRYYHAGLFRGRWTSKILEEWTTSLLHQKPDSSEIIYSQQKMMQKHFPEACISGYETLSLDVSLPDENDNHVLAAAIKCDAQHIVTDNIKDFPNEILEPFGIESITADEFLFRTSELYAEESIMVIKAMREEYYKPAFSPPEFIMDLNAKGLPKLASWVKERQDLLN